MKNCLVWILLSIFPATVVAQNGLIIAHRGGVVDSTFTENGKPALETAAQKGFGSIETDIRLTRDGVLIANHDRDFKRYYGKSQLVTDTDWQEIRTFKSEIDQTNVLNMDSVLALCAAHQLTVMIDNKIGGLPLAAFETLLALLDKYGLRSSALMIGTEESTEFFTGKIRLSCTRKQIEENMHREGYRPEHYFLFERATRLAPEDVAWAGSRNIMVVAAINKFHYRNQATMMNEAKNDIIRLQNIGVRNFQIDSEFLPLIKNR